MNQDLYSTVGMCLESGYLKKYLYFINLNVELDTYLC